MEYLDNFCKCQRSMNAYLKQRSCETAAAETADSEAKCGSASDSAAGTDASADPDADCVGRICPKCRRPLPPGRDAAGVRPPALAAAFVRSVRDAAGAMVQICGFVVFFLAALRLTARLTGLSHPLLSGAVELTQGILALPATPTGFVWAAALLGWGGLSVHGQSAAVLSGTDLPLGPYLAAKAAQAALSALLAWPVSRYLWG